MTVTLPAPILHKICRRFEARGKLSGSMQLSRDPSPEERTAFENFFGLAPLTCTAQGAIRLSFDRLLSGKNTTEKTAWIDHIYQLAQRQRPEPKEKEDFPARTLEQLSLAYPELIPIHQFLSEERGNLRPGWTRDPEGMKQHIFLAAEIVHFLQTNRQPLTLSELGARFCHNSKALRQGGLKNTVEEWLRLLRADVSDEEDIWGEFQLFRDRLTISVLVYGPLTYTKNGRKYDWIFQLYRAGEAAMLNWSQLEGISDLHPAPESDHITELISCENEAPFSRLIRENKAGRIVLFTSGFPNRAVCRIYQQLAPQVGRCRHWGDSDPAGLRIAAMLQAMHPLSLWRCDLATLKRHQACLLPLNRKQKEAAATLLQSTTFPFSDELAFTDKNGWLEQESWNQ